MTASAGGFDGSTSVTVKARPPTITSVTASPNPVTGTFTTLIVTATDDLGPAALTYTWTAKSWPAGPPVLSSNNGTKTGNSVTATFSEAGSYAFTVTVTDTDNLSTTSSPLSVTVSQTLISMTVAPSPVTVPYGGTESFTAAGKDQFGNAMSPTVAWTTNVPGATIGAATGQFLAPKTQVNGTVTATSGSISAIAIVNVFDTAPTVATTASATPNPVTGTTTALSVLGAYVGVGGESSLTYTWTVALSNGATTPIYSSNGTHASQNTTVRFTSAGTYNFTVTIADPFGKSATSPVSVVVQPTLTSMAVSPNPAKVVSLTTQQFTVGEKDQFGNAMSLVPVWSTTVPGATIGAATGLFTAPAGAVSGNVTATCNGFISTVAVTVAPTISLSYIVAPALIVQQNLTYTATYIGTATTSWSWGDKTANTAGTVTKTNGVYTVTASHNYTTAGPYTVTLTLTAPTGYKATVSTPELVIKQGAAAMTSDPLYAGKTALLVGGVAGATDTILVGPGTTAGTVRVAINNVIVGTFATPTGHLIVYGMGTNDAIDVGSSITTTAWLFGGPGTDTLMAGGGKTLLYGDGGKVALSYVAGRDLPIPGVSTILNNTAALYGVATEWENGQTVVVPAVSKAVAGSVTQSSSVSTAGTTVSPSAALLPAVTGVSTSSPSVQNAASVPQADTGNVSGSKASDLFFASYCADAADPLATDGGESPDRHVDAMSDPVSFRYDIEASDPEHIRALTESTGVFSPGEIEIAVELADERLAKGPSSGYHFVFAEGDGQVRGYTCYGPIALTIGSYDLYWIAVSKSSQGLGLGRVLLEKSEALIRQSGGRRVYIETSTRPPYAPTRAFYERCNYHLEVVLKDFYASGDGKAIYMKAI